MPTPVKYDSHGTWESNNYHGLGWSAKNDPGSLDEKSRKLFKTPLASDAVGRIPKAPVFRTSNGRWEAERLGKGSGANYRMVGLASQVHLDRMAPEGADRFDPREAIRDARMWPTPIRSDAAVSKNMLTLQKVENGEAFNQLSRADRTAQLKEAGLWESNPDAVRGAAERDRDVRKFPTPIANDARRRSTRPAASIARREAKGIFGLMLSERVKLDQVRKFPTPTAEDSNPKRSKAPPPRVRLTESGLPEADRPSGSGAQLGLMQAAVIADRQKFPTPTHMNGLRNGAEPGTSGGEHQPMMWQSPGHPEYGELNAEWVEWLMGWPIGWTSLEPMDPAQFELWWSLMGGSPATGLPAWWDADPSDDGEWLGRPVPKTVVPRDKADDELRISRVAALGNGQVSAVVAAQTILLASWELPEGE